MNKKEVALFLMLIFASLTKAQVYNSKFRTYTLYEIEKIVPLPGQFKPIAIVKDSLLIQYLPESMRKDYVKNAERFLKKAWNVIDITDPLIVNSWKGVPLYRIRLTVKSQALKGKIEYKIK